MKALTSRNMENVRITNCSKRQTHSITKQRVTPWQKKLTRP
jgi:hypothetical protein